MWPGGWHPEGKKCYFHRSKGMKKVFNLLFVPLYWWVSPSLRSMNLGQTFNTFIHEPSAAESDKLLEVSPTQCKVLKRLAVSFTHEVQWWKRTREGPVVSGCPCLSSFFFLKTCVWVSVTDNNYVFNLVNLFTFCGLLLPCFADFKNWFHICSLS